MSTVSASVHEVRHEVRLDLSDAPALTNLAGRTRKPVGLWITYGLCRDVTRADLIVQWTDEAERWTPAAPTPAWMRELIDAYAPRDVDEPEANRPTGRYGHPVTACTAGEKATASAATTTPRRYGRRLAMLLDAIRTHQGRWTTSRVQALYRLPGVNAPQRCTARRDLHALHQMGHLTLCGPENGRYYLLARNGGTK